MQDNMECDWFKPSKQCNPVDTNHSKSFNFKIRTNTQQKSQPKIIVFENARNAQWNAFKMHNEMHFKMKTKFSSADINKQNWRFNHIFSDHKPGFLLYVILRGRCLTSVTEIYE